MKVYLDDSPVAVTRPTLADALREARALAAARGRIIIEALADGAPAPDAHLSDPDSAATTPYAGELRFVSEAPRALVRAALTDAAGALLEAKSAQSDAADRLHEGRTNEAVSGIGAALRIWEQVKQAVEQGGMILEERLDRAQGMPELITGLTDRLSSLQSALERRDWAGVADELSYELNDHADAWRSALLAIANDLD